MSHDVIVIGSGSNGLVAAHMLAAAGRSVLVLDEQPQAMIDFDAGWVVPKIIEKLALLDAGFVERNPDPWISIPLDDGSRLELPRDVRRAAEAIRRVSPHDAARWVEFSERMQQLAKVLEALYAEPAPDVETTEPGELLHLASLGAAVRLRGRQVVVDLLRTLPMSVAELLDDWFEHDRLKAAVGAAGILHMHQGPRSAGTAFVLLHHCTGSPTGVFRSPVTNLGRVLEMRAGFTIRRGAVVERITVSAGRATGVTLVGGEHLPCRVVVSSADPRRTMLELLEPGWLDPELARAFHNIKMRGVVARVILSVSRRPGFDTLPVAPSLTFIEKAYDAAKYGRVSDEPFLEATVPRDDQVTVHVQYAPKEPTDGPWTEARKAALGEQVTRRLLEVAPEMRGTITHTEVQTPKDFEERGGVTGGHMYHGELTLDQVLFMRPVPGWSRYRTPVRSLYLCSAGCHPGGAVAGGAGRLAAFEVLKERA